MPAQTLLQDDQPYLFQYSYRQTKRLKTILGNLRLFES
jgi:hypothetical protein